MGSMRCDDAIHCLIEEADVVLLAEVAPRRGVCDGKMAGFADEDPRGRVDAQVTGQIGQIGTEPLGFVGWGWREWVWMGGSIDR
jgi:hypothetical protein